MKTEHWANRRALMDKSLRIQFRIFLIPYLIMTVLVIERLLTKEVTNF